MSKFRYYITDLYDGDVKGTNDFETANNYAECEDYFVIDVEANEWMISGNENRPIAEAIIDERD